MRVILFNYSLSFADLDSTPGISANIQVSHPSPNLKIKNLCCEILTASDFAVIWYPL